MKSDDREKVANITPFGLRLQPELKRRVEDAARANGRSLNAEIAARLEKSFQDEGGTQISALEKRLGELEEKVENGLALLWGAMNALSGKAGKLENPGS